jgi:flotillin
MFFWHVPAPNEALLISGSKRRQQDTQFRIVTGHGCFVLPVKQKARVLSLALRESEIVEDCIGYINNLAAQRSADLAAQRLEAEVRRPADAQAYKQRTLAEAERDQAKFTAEGEAFRRTTLAAAEAEAARIQADAAAYAERATATAQADANRALAGSLAQGNQELIAASRVVDALPALVASAAQGIAASNLTVLNGTDGISQVVAGIVGQGYSILDTLRKSATPVQNGPAQNGPEEPPAPPR